MASLKFYNPTTKKWEEISVLATGLEPSFGTLKVGEVSMNATANNKNLTFIAGEGISLTADGDKNELVIASTVDTSNFVSVENVTNIVQTELNSTVATTKQIQDLFSDEED